MFVETADIESSTKAYATRFSGPVGAYFLEVQTQITLRYLSSESGSTVLDVGGGHAQLAVPLARAQYQVTVTGSAESCRMLLDEQLAPSEFTFTVCDLLSLPYDDDSFDFVLAYRLLPHVDRWPQLLAEMCRVARTAVIFDYPDKRSSNVFYDLLFSFKKRYEKDTRTFTLFKRSEIAAALARHNFSTPQFTPQFFLPMVIHRSLKQVALSRGIEGMCKALQLTKLFGSPIIVKSKKTHAPL